MGTIREQILLASTLPSGTIRELLSVPNTGTGTGTGGTCVIDVELEAIDSVIVTEPEAAGVELQGEDFNVEMPSQEIIVEDEDNC